MIIYALIGFAVIMASSFLRGTRDKYDDFCRKAWEDFGPGGKLQPGLLKERKAPK